MTPTINADRLWQSIMDIAAIGPTPEGGSNRMALTPEDTAARALFLDWCKAAGLAFEQDAIGNMFLRRAGTDPAAHAVAFGSHLDTVPTGGRFDGVFGVLAGLEVMRTLHDAGLSHAGAAGAGELDQRGRQPVPPGDDGQPRARRRPAAGGRARHHRRPRDQRRAGAARLRPGRRADPGAARLGLLAGGAYRARPGAGSGRRRHRHRHRNDARALLPTDGDRRAQPCRSHVDGAPPRQPGRDRRGDPGDRAHRARRRAAWPGLGDLDRKLPECARQRGEPDAAALRCPPRDRGPRDRDGGGVARRVGRHRGPSPGADRGRSLRGVRPGAVRPDAVQRAAAQGRGPAVGGARHDGGGGA